MVLYPAEGNPLSMTPYPNPGTAVVDSAGMPLTVVAKIFDKANNWLSSYETIISPVTWSLVELAGNTDVPTGTVAPSSGDKTVLSATKAYNSVLIIAEFKEGGQTFDDSIKVTIVPARPLHLVIESSADRTQSPHKDNPDTLVQIPSSQSYALVYAIIRDAYGNYIDVSHTTVWTSLDSTVVTATNGGTQGQGQITRAAAPPRDRAQVMAASLDYPGLKDTTTAVVLQYYYLALRIVNPQGVPISGLTMNTNQDTTLYVQGQRSTDGVWEQASAAVWQSSSGLNIVPVAPGNAASWTFSPVTPGSGAIRVTSLNNDTVTTKPGFINVTFTVGPPTGVQIQILTPPDSLIAGDTIVSVVKISNKDGLVPGNYCDSAAYVNALGGLPGHSPVVIADTTVTLGQSMKECFNNGVDTVKYVLYRAPSGTDTLDHITVTLGGISATTEPFLIHPGNLARIAIQDFTGKNLDSVSLTYPTGSQLFLAVGYDAYGNIRGPENSNWTTDSTLHPITNGTDVSRVFYQATQSKYDEAGHIVATVKGANNALITDSVYASIAGPQAHMTSAMTRDINGDGYLDQIVLHFDKTITWPDSGAYSITFSGSYQDPVTGENVTYSLTVGSVSARNGTKTDSVFTITLDEPKSSDPMSKFPETGWTPKITISGLSGVSPVVNVPATDGAGPVIWMVTKTIGSPNLRTDDKVTVVFSEPIGTNGNDFNSSLAPGSVILVWQKQTTAAGTDTFVQVPVMLSGIKDFFQVDSNISVVFYMTNGNDLTSLDYLSLSSDSTGKSLSDRSGLVNAPDANNKKVQVVISSPPVRQILVAPNPSSPTFNRERAGELHLAYQPNARTWVRQDGAGSILTFKIVPVAGQIITGRLLIYDAIGNTVALADSSNSSTGIIPPSWISSTSSTYDYDIYWNGSNARGLRCAAGVYRTFLVLWYKSANGSGTKSISRLQGTVGIR